MLLTVSAVYLVRKEHFFWSAVLIMLSTATRVTGVLLIPLYLIEVFKSKKKLNLIWMLITPLGLISYMYYLKVQFGDPLYFLTSQPIFGAERSTSEIILLPQVIYRYVKIFLATNVMSLPFFNALLEFVFTLVPLGFLIILFKKMRLSYWVFSISTLLFGTLTGTFSSQPRYALFSIVLLLPYLVFQYKKYIKPVILVSALLGIVLTMLFIRGYWIS